MRLDLLDLYGVEYLFSFIKAEYEQEQKEMLFKNYVADSLVSIVKELGVVIGQSLDPPRYSDIVNNGYKEVEEKDPQEVINGIKNKLNLMQEE